MFKKGKKPEYKSPISVDRKVIGKEIVKYEEDKVMGEIRWKLQVDVDKEELLKALAYDRNQYEQGYKDAKAIYEKALEKACRILADRNDCPKHALKECGLNCDERCHSYIYDEDCWKVWAMKDE